MRQPRGWQQWGLEFAEDADALERAARPLDDLRRRRAVGVARLLQVRREAAHTVVCAAVHRALAGRQVQRLVGRADRALEGVEVAQGDEALRRAVIDERTVVEFIRRTERL